MATARGRRGDSAPSVGNTRARYRRILRFAARYIVQTWWFELVLPRVGLSKFVARGRAARLTRIAQRFHVLAVDLGGLMIKVGQYLSSRLDILPPEITKELAGLQDEVPPVPFDAIQRLAEAELGVPLERAYASFDPTPLAAASLGQAHRARLAPIDAADMGYDEAVVKVQRPGIETIVAVDLKALRRVAGWLSRVRFVANHVDLPSLVEEFAGTSLQEIDYLQEARYAERFAASFAGDPRVAAPEVVWERTTRRVLTLADVTAIKINDREALLAAGIDPKAVAKQFAAVMFDQLFRDGFFHADPHPGNIFVTPVERLADAAVPGYSVTDAAVPASPSTSPAAASPGWRLTFIDFGMMGEVPDGLRRGLQQLLLAVAARDGKRLVDSIRGVGILLPSADTEELERAMSALFARFGGMGLAELQQVDERELRSFAIEFGETMRALPFQLPENFLLVIRSMSLTSGLCSSLDPEFNMWDAVEPYANQLLRDERGNFVQALGKEALTYAGTVARLPQRLDALADRVEEGRLVAHSPRLEQRVARLERTTRRITSAVLFVGVFIGGILLRVDEPVWGGVLIAVSVIPLLHALFAGVFGRRGRG
ncbi:putative unusual protein kinase regulating ubiquinone biosynthesis (AarF/ABC1/UbiB family) [Agromyces ramosus]|uniref:Putative unusual protein kinase regulating ubiquinone biosynthesis (AarF/ABC1/UbiB family) n=1 Tax=Agromyces ramosus TaxID=33879 RepID=A0A4Q7MK84_9MICO|nr:AarF/UbiB family protein [Agromyces ramosus]RZS68287.1 putative unusual protein kinase regulating ubiquinone biosynthesis (AarF/ABC1/UbiB family) [Agromyces ramosus]